MENMIALIYMIESSLENSKCTCTIRFDQQVSIIIFKYIFKCLELGHAQLDTSRE